MQYMNRRHALYIALSVVVVLLLYCRPREVDLLPQQIYQKQQHSRQQQPFQTVNIIENIDKEKVSHDCKLICNLVQSIGLCSRMWGSRRQIIIIDSAFPIKSGPRFGSRIRQVEKVDSEQGFRFHIFYYIICLRLGYMSAMRS